ncbi:MAG: twin-arginine translocase TatA/TatE family subunit [Anaerolineales bacterium]
MPFAIQPIHIIIILLVAFLIFGANKLPEMGRSLGKGISEFRKGTKEAAEGFKQELSDSSNVPAGPVQADSSVTAHSAIPAGNFCIQCGSKNPPESRFCAACGTKLPY